MRIVGGKYKGKRFTPPNGIPTRPTTDISKEALFNILNNYYNFDNVRFLDLFAGTGNHGYEFASRGCTDITSIEQFPKCVKFINKTIEDWGIEGMRVLQMDVFAYIDNCKEQFDIIFAGPPYPLPTLDDIPDLIFKNDLVEGKGWFIMEHDPSHDFDDHPNFIKKRNYGQTIFSIFSNID